MAYEKYICGGAVIFLVLYCIYFVVTVYLDSPKKTTESITKKSFHYLLVPFREKLIFQDNENYMFLFVKNNGNITHGNITLGKIPKRSTSIIYIAENEEPYLEKIIISLNYLSRKKSPQENFVKSDHKYVLHCSPKSISDVSAL